MTSAETTEQIRAYLDGLSASDEPVVDHERVAALRAEVEAATDPIDKLKLLTALEQAEAGTMPDRSGDEAAFVAEAKAWAEAEGVSAAAFIALGVPAEVLTRAGIDIPEGVGRPRRRGGRPAGKGTPAIRAPRIPLDQVEQVARTLPSPFTLRQLAEAVDRDTTTARNYVTRLIGDRVLVDVGEDPDHDGRGRPPRRYALA